MIISLIRSSVLLFFLLKRQNKTNLNDCSKFSKVTRNRGPFPGPWHGRHELLPGAALTHTHSHARAEDRVPHGRSASCRAVDGRRWQRTARWVSWHCCRRSRGSPHLPWLPRVAATRPGARTHLHGHVHTRVQAQPQTLMLIHRYLQARPYAFTFLCAHTTRLHGHACTLTYKHE